MSGCLTLKQTSKCYMLRLVCIKTKYVGRKLCTCREFLSDGTKDHLEGITRSVGSGLYRLLTDAPVPVALPLCHSALCPGAYLVCRLGARFACRLDKPKRPTQILSTRSKSIDNRPRRHHHRSQHPSPSIPRSQGHHRDQRYTSRRVTEHPAPRSDQLDLGL